MYESMYVCMYVTHTLFLRYKLVEGSFSNPNAYICQKTLNWLGAVAQSISINGAYMCVHECACEYVCLCVRVRYMYVCACV